METKRDSPEVTQPCCPEHAADALLAEEPFLEGISCVAGHGLQTPAGISHGPAGLYTLILCGAEMGKAVGTAAGGAMDHLRAWTSGTGSTPGLCREQGRSSNAHTGTAASSRLLPLSSLGLWDCANAWTQRLMSPPWVCVLSLSAV